MGKFGYLFISQGDRSKQDNNKLASGINLDKEMAGNLYVKGDVYLNGESIFNDSKKEKERIINIFGKKHSLPASVEAHADWEILEFTTELWGTYLCCKMRIKSKKALTKENIANVAVVNADVFTYGAISNVMNNAFTNSSAGPVCSFYTNKNSASVENKKVKFAIVLTSIGSELRAGGEISANFYLPVALNYKAFPID